MILMGLFKYNHNIQSYIYPVSKIIFCVSLLVLIINRNSLIKLETPFMNTIVRIACLGVSVAAVLCIYISIAEMILLHERREQISIDMSFALECGQEKPIDDIMSLLIANDILEITTILNSQTIKIGVTSDCHPGSSQYFDKNYYIDDVCYAAIDDFREELGDLFKTGIIYIVAIDGIPLG